MGRMSLVKLTEICCSVLQIKDHWYHANLDLLANQHKRESHKLESSREEFWQTKTRDWLEVKREAGVGRRYGEHLFDVETKHVGEGCDKRVSEECVVVLCDVVPADETRQPYPLDGVTVEPNRLHSPISTPPPTVVQKPV
jgi:hypothetical protein